ncbi:MAG: tetratricopeptide repeat protein [Prevotella sp.]|nr:tetratricopeptide repeat protein [Prevotella sp.]
MDKSNDIVQEAIDDRIDAFIRGKMTAEEETVFKSEIQADPELRSQVLATVSLIRGIRTQNAEKEQTILQNYANNRVRSILLWACSVAAVFAIMFGYSKDRRYDELSSIISPYYAEYSMSDISRGEVDSATVAHLYTLFNNVKEQRNVTNIIKELESIYATLDTDFTYNAYANDIAWNLALAYIKNDQTDKAITILQKLKANNPDTPIYNKADELIKKLQYL